MARILCCWERGSALGHLSSLRPFIERAVYGGHDVTLVARELRHIDAVLGDLPVRVLQAPYANATPHPDGAPVESVGMLLETFYSHDSSLLDALCRAWDHLFRLLVPDVVIYDHAPFALIASWGGSWAKWVVGSGFLVPRTDEEIFGRFPRQPGSGVPDNARFVASNSAAVEAVNGYLRKTGCAPIDDLSDVWKQADRNWLLTLPELDHFGERSDEVYLGIPPGSFGGAISWPDRAGPKVVGYLAECAALRPLLSLLNDLNINGVFYTRDLLEEEIAQYPNLAIHMRPLDLGHLLRDADLGINMGGHKTVAETYLAGVPQLLLLRHQEQLLLFLRVMALRAGVGVNAKMTDLRRPLEAAFALMKRGIQPVSAERAHEMSGARLTREIDAAFGAMTSAR